MRRCGPCGRSTAFEAALYSASGDRLAGVLDGIADQSPQGARRVQSRILKTIDLLTEHPHGGQRTSHPTLRRIVVRPYPCLIFDRVIDAELIIIGVRQAARDPASMPDAP